MKSQIFRSGAALLPGTALLLSSFSAMGAGAGAADATAEPPELQEIVVTAQKREQRIQDVPISLSVMGGADLDKSTVQSVSDALGMVPGVAVNVTGQGGETQLIIRGVTASGSYLPVPAPSATTSIPCLLGWYDRLYNRMPIPMISTASRCYADRKVPCTARAL